MFQKRIRYSLVLSLLFHVVLVALMVLLPKMQTPPQHDITEVKYLSPEDVQKILAKQFRKEDLKQIVEQAEKAVNDETLDNAKFLSRHNQVVKKQTQAANHGQFKNAEQNKTTGQGSGAKQLAVKDLTPKMDFEKAYEHKIQQEQQFEKSTDADALKMAELQKRKASQPQVAVQPGTNGAEASQTQDYLKDVQTANETLLTTREFVYYTFYERIRVQLNQYWSGKVRDKLTRMFKEGRSIASTDDRITKLLITMDKNGNIVKVQVLGPSGVRDLDEAAIEAFQAAAPFPHPPKGLVESDGTIKVRWDFVLEV
jgi:protein TonB